MVTYLKSLECKESIATEISLSWSLILLTEQIFYRIVIYKAKNYCLYFLEEKEVKLQKRGGAEIIGIATSEKDSGESGTTRST